MEVAFGMQSITRLIEAADIFLLSRCAFEDPFSLPSRINRQILSVFDARRRRRLIVLKFGPPLVVDLTKWGAARFDETADCGRGHRNRRSNRWIKTRASSPRGRRRAPRPLTPAP